MGSLVIVALPADDDIVWKVSSEKVPHMTLMFLGEETDDNSVNRMTEFVAHALSISEHGPFYLDVDYRDELGDDKADVLFFRQGWDSKWIKSLRGQLLQQADIRAAFEANDQYPEWVPHLTLGYPDTPAKPIPDDRTIYSVCFDRIAIWTGDYEGPEFRLQWPNREEDSILAYSNTGRDVVEEFLEHHGVKGMKWGVRKETPSTGSTTFALAYIGPLANLSPEYREGTSAKTKILTASFGALALVDPSVRRELQGVAKKQIAAQSDKEWERGLANGQAWVEVHNGMADHFNAHIDGVNAKWDKKLPDRDWSDQDVHNPTDPQFKAYMADMHKLTKESIDHAASQMYLKNPSGTKKVVVEQDPDEPLTFRLRQEGLKHADSPPEIKFRVAYKVSKNNRVSGFEIVDGDDDTLAQTIDLGIAFLEHHGVKGMKWGVRRDNLQNSLHTRRLSAEADRREKRPARDVRAYDTIGKSSRRPSAIDTKGGEDHPPTEDAIKVAKARQKLKKSGAAALSNAELREVANRLQLEQQVSQLEGRHKRSFFGKKFVDQHLSNNPKNQKKLGGVAIKVASKALI